MQGPIRCVVVAGLLIGCSGDDTVLPDDDAAVVGTGGLVVEWSSQPEAWPGTLADGIVIERAKFAFDSLRVVGDAGPGDPRTTATAFEVRWDESTAPSQIMFSEAPTGLYSQVSVLIDGLQTNDSYELRGHVMVGDTNWPFRVEDDDPMAFTVQMAKTLTPPATATVMLRINFEAALRVVDWSMVDPDGSELELDEDDPQMAMFRTTLIQGFEIVDANSGRGEGVP